MLKKILIISALSVLLVACSGEGEDEKSTKVKPLQKNDKNLSCREILLEMNEAEFYSKMAHNQRGVKLKSVLMPLGYISTYVDSGEAINAAKARVEYLDKIYEILHCESREKELEKLPVYQGPQSHLEGPGAVQYSASAQGAQYYLAK
jgi:hypothetical protein